MRSESNSSFTHRTSHFRYGFVRNKVLIRVIVLGLVSIVVLNHIRNLQIKARDAQRKTDLANVQAALEEYYKNDGRYPPAVSLPKDPIHVLSYSYQVTSDGSKYRLLGFLENTKDEEFIGKTDVECGAVACNFGLASPGAKVGEPL